MKTGRPQGRPVFHCSEAKGVSSLIIDRLARNLPTEPTVGFMGGRLEGRPRLVAKPYSRHRPRCCWSFASGPFFLPSIRCDACDCRRAVAAFPRGWGRRPFPCSIHALASAASAMSKNSRRPFAIAHRCDIGAGSGLVFFRSRLRLPACRPFAPSISPAPRQPASPPLP